MQRLFQRFTAFLLLFGQVGILCLSACMEKDHQQHLTPLQELGRHLFFEPHVSLTHTRSCASCHEPHLAFTDGYRRSVSPQGENLLHNAPSLLNTADFLFYDWANPQATSYERQLQRPLYGRHPVELGVDQHWDEFLTFLSQNQTYSKLIEQSFTVAPRNFTPKQLEQALVAYLRTLQATNSPYDRYLSGDRLALTSIEQRGLYLFQSPALACSRCHTPPAFTRAAQTSDTASVYVNIGLYNIGGQNRYPARDPGLYASTRKESDHGRFRIPSLRNVALTAPYMHDGSMETLNEVLDHYQRGGRTIEAGPDAGDGQRNHFKDPLIKGFTLSPSDRHALLSFLFALTDTSYLRQEHVQNPFRNKN